MDSSTFVTGHPIPYAVHGDPTTIPAPSPGTPDQGLTYRASYYGQLADFIDHIYNNHELPGLRKRIRVVVLSEQFDSMETSGLLELLYVYDWDKASTPAGVQTTVPSPLVETPIKKPHPFTTLIEDLWLTYFVSSPEEFRRLGNMKLYISIVMALLRVCRNLEIIFLPRSWMDNGVKFWGLRKLKFIGYTEDLEDVEAEKQRREAEQAEREAGVV